MITTSKQYPSIDGYDKFRKDATYDLERKRYRRCMDDGCTDDDSSSSPQMRLRGRVKLHGTNGCVVQTLNDERRSVFSRNRRLTVDDDNMGFAAFVARRVDAFDEIFSRLSSALFGEADEIAVVGEYCGGNIQKHVALAKFPKMFVVFAVRVDGKWRDDLVGLCYSRDETVLEVSSFGEYDVLIDLDDDRVGKAYIDSETLAVDSTCPFAKELAWRRIRAFVSGLRDEAEAMRLLYGIVDEKPRKFERLLELLAHKEIDETTRSEIDELVCGPGEGIVWVRADQPSNPRYWCKTKGPTHRFGPTKADFESEKSDSAESTKSAIDSFVAKHVPCRLEQGIEFLVEHNMEISMKSVKTFIWFVFDDLLKESSYEIDDLFDSTKIDRKILQMHVNKHAVEWFKNLTSKS